MKTSDNNPRRLLTAAVIVSFAICQSYSQLLSNDNNEVSLTTYKVIKDATKGSLVVSPFSVRVMMAMMMAGARGNTREQLAKMMKFPKSEEELFETYRQYLHQLNSPSSVKTEIANRVFLKEGFVVQENFQTILKHHFQSPMQQVNFQTPKKAAEEINNFVARKTQNKIQRIVESTDITNQTRMVLINTLYFKGAWENPFPTSSSRKMPFYLDASGRNVTVNMMRVETYLRAVEFREYGCKAVVIPYQKEKNSQDGYEMVLLIPNRRDGLENLEKSLGDFENIESVYDVRPRNIELRVPRFRIESSVDLVGHMRQMGITDLFDKDKANLEGIPTAAYSKSGKKTKENNLYVGKMLQKAFLNVDEAGSEAGAATLSVVFVPLSVGPPVEEVITADRPFFGFIRDSRTNTILFTFRKAE